MPCAGIPLEMLMFTNCGLDDDFRARWASGGKMKSETMSEVTKLLQVVDGGDPKAAEDLPPLLYKELRLLAAVRRDEGRSAP